MRKFLGKILRVELVKVIDVDSYSITEIEPFISKVESKKLLENYYFKKRLILLNIISVEIHLKK